MDEKLKKASSSGNAKISGFVRATCAVLTIVLNRTEPRRAARRLQRPVSRPATKQSREATVAVRSPGPQGLGIPRGVNSTPSPRRRQLRHPRSTAFPPPVRGVRPRRRLPPHARLASRLPANPHHAAAAECRVSLDRPKSFELQLAQGCLRMEESERWFRHWYALRKVYLTSI
jgi:hypothetical protein